MLEMTRLNANRQRRVFLSLAEVRDDKAFVRSLDGRVRDALEGAVTAGQPLGARHSIPPLVVDNSSDAAFAGLYNLVVAVESAVLDRVVDPSPEAVAAKRAASTIVLRAYPDGVSFLSQSMALQYEGMTRVVDRLRNDAPCADAVKTLRLGWMVDHMEAHLAPYGRVVNRGDTRDTEAASGTFHAAFRTLALRVLDQYEGDADVRARLLGAYERELEAQRDDERASRKRRAKDDAPPEG